MSLMLLGGVGHHGRPAHAVADDEHRRELAERSLLLLPDHALDRRGTAAAVLFRPVQAGPAGVGFCLLPRLGDVEDIGVLELGAAERGGAQIVLILLWRVGGDPGASLAAECGLLRSVVEVHGRVLLASSFRGPSKTRTSGAQLRIGESGGYSLRDSGLGCFATAPE